MPSSWNEVGGKDMRLVERIKILKYLYLKSHLHTMFRIIQIK